MQFPEPDRVFVCAANSQILEILASQVLAESDRSTCRRSTLRSSSECRSVGL